MNKYVLFFCTITLILIKSRSGAQTVVATSLADLEASTSCLKVNTESFRYLLFDVQLAFDDAKSFCASLEDLDDPILNTGFANPNFFLARVSSLAERTQLIVLLITQVPVNRKNFWIGLEDEDDDGGTDPSVRFLRWVDGTSEGLGSGEFLGRGGFLPWDVSQPDDANNNQNCVRWNVASNLLDDQICSQTNGVLCRVECEPNAFPPSTAPTESPAIVTNAPTISPLAADLLADLKRNQIVKIAGASVLSVVGLFLIFGIIYGIKSIYKEKQDLNLAMAGAHKKPNFKDFQLGYVSPPPEVKEYATSLTHSKEQPFV